MSDWTIPFLLAMLLLAGSGCRRESTRAFDLQPLWDTGRALQNPSKGWYHHALDNGISKYGLNDASLIERFPGMDHLYLRLAWSYLEPEEGHFNWAYIDAVTGQYLPEELLFSFRITAKETGAAPDSVGEEVDGVMYATPYWVRQAGAQGVVTTLGNTSSWTPDWDDPVFLEKLEQFHRAFAARYDGKPWVLYVDVGSIGEWGEGHTHFSTRVPPTVEEVKKNIDVYLRCYEKTQIVVTDDLLYYGKSDEDVQELLDYVVDRGITLRDDSPLVGWYVENHLDTWTVSHPHFFERVYLERPTILEAEHYRAVLRNGHWLGMNGEEEIPGKGVSGADILRGALETIHASYIGYHGDMGQWLRDNPGLAGELANRCGYWYFPVEASLPRYIEKGTDSLIAISWTNKGVAPSYTAFQLQIKLQSEQGDSFESIISDAGNRKWLPDEVVAEEYSVLVNESLRSGDYRLKIKLYDPLSGESVDIGLREDLRDEVSYYTIAETTIE